MQMSPMVTSKKMMALKELIKQMFELEAKGEGDSSIDPSHALEESMESPEEETAEHAGGLTEAEEMHGDGEDADLKETMSKFFKKSSKSPIIGKTKKVMARVDMPKPKERKTLG